MADSLLVLLLLPSLGLAGLEGFGEAADVALCELSSMADRDAVDAEDLLDLGGEVCEGLARWNHANSLNKLLLFCRLSCLSVSHFNYKIYSCYLKSRESFDYLIDNLFQSIDFPHLVLQERTPLLLHQPLLLQHPLQIPHSRHELLLDLQQLVDRFSVPLHLATKIPPLD